LNAPEISSKDKRSSWLGNELRARQDWEWRFTTKELNELERLSGDHNENLDRIQETELSRQKLRSIRESLEYGSGAVMLRDFPLDRLESDLRTEKVSEIFLWLVSQVGTPVSQSAAGDLILSVRNEAFGKDDSRTRGPNTNRRLSFHTDRCDVIAFLCLKQARKGGENELVSSPALYKAIREERPDLLEILMKPFPYKRHVVDKGNALPYCEQPIFSFCDGHFAGSFLRVLIDRADADPDCPSLTDEQREALEFLEETAEREDLRVRFRQEPGDILFLNNWVTFHRRTAFEDWPELDRRRHLLRVWLSVPNSRPLAEAFKTNYGSVAAGSIRGGMPPEAA
jgi:alpha-ketoglutarate-dependent taurine dioxygenase